MAEFTEVCKQAFRKAEAESGMKPHYVFLFVSATGTNVVAHTGKLAVPPEKLEADIMQWAAEHPEPKYPTWYGMWKQLFPTAECVPCIKVAIGNEYQPKEGCDAIRCDVCKMRHIPADIAKKLNIQPIEPIEWEEEE